MPRAVLDERGRILLPREVAEKLALSKHDAVVFEERGDQFLLMRAPLGRERLEEIMDWNPSRSGRVEPVSPKTIKEIWKK